MIKKEGEDGETTYVTIEKVIEQQSVSFFRDTKEVQVGDRFYVCDDTDQYESILSSALTNGFVDVAGLNYRQEERNNRRPQNHGFRRNNRGGYNKNYNRNNRGGYNKSYNRY